MQFTNQKMARKQKSIGWKIKPKGLIFFKKPIDKSSGLCYNNLRKVERTTKRKGENKNDYQQKEPWT